MAEAQRIEIDLHGYHPDEIDIPDLVKQAWGIGASEFLIVHGHGRGRGITPGFVNTNTGYFGLRVRRAVRGNKALKPYAKISKIGCRHWGSTTVELKKNPNPSRARIGLAPPSLIAERREAAPERRSRGR